ncbi:MAG: hypothetical protein JWL70_3113, partial [Acidimicrobiia bacterium]|nr:hypothetical protein [Acidimicrobiia bacterium]
QYARLWEAFETSATPESSAVIHG